ncbi:MAG: GNAT family N-acetyltransferase [Desulfurococcales archaeon]|nr:GNAT family N-acetyltransferase [Desulfurococcales archaeon]
MEIVVERGSLRVLEELLTESMGEWHSYYAVEAVRGGIAEYLLAYIDGAPRGGIVYYSIPFKRGGDLTIIYYVVVSPRARGHDIGRILVLSVEEIAGSKAYLATIGEGNIASRRMFESIGYRIYTYDSIEESHGHAIARKIARASCGYEDSMVAVKPGDTGLGLIADLDDDAVERVFQAICYRPWKRLRRREAIRVQ